MSDLWQRGFTSGRASAFIDAASSARKRAEFLRSLSANNVASQALDDLALVLEYQAKLADNELKRLGPPKEG